MISEDDKIKKLFKEFQPDLTDDREFISQVKIGLDALELFKESEKKRRLQLRRATFLSALAGFLCGVILTLLSPVISNLITPFLLNIQDFSFDREILISSLTWCLIAFSSILLTFGSYSLFSSKTFSQFLIKSKP